MINVKKLQSGITLVSEFMPEMQSAALGIWVKAGAVNEKPEMAGVSHYIEHMMFKGTKKRTAAQLAEDMDKIGGQMNAFTGKEMTCYYFKSLKSNMEQGMEIMLDMFSGSIFDAEEMAREKQVIYEEMKMIKDSPDDEAMDEIGEALFPNSPYGQSIIGTEETMGPIGRPQLMDYLKEQYTKDSITVALAGNFDLPMVESRIEEKLGDLRTSKERPVLTTAMTPPDRRVLVRDIKQAHLCLATRTGIAIDDKRDYAMSVLNAIFGGGMSSRLFQHVRERKGLAYSVFSAATPYTADGYNLIYAGVAMEKVQEAIGAIKEELDLLHKEGVTSEEIAKVKEQIKSSYIFGQEAVSGRMMGIGRDYTLRGRVREQEEVLEAINAVTAEDLAQVASLITDTSTYCGVAVTGKDFDLNDVLGD